MLKYGKVRRATGYSSISSKITCVRFSFPKMKLNNAIILFYPVLDKVIGRYIPNSSQIKQLYQETVKGPLCL